VARAFVHRRSRHDSRAARRVHKRVIASCVPKERPVAGASAP